uniref:HAT C-terminal dimerisation domain-containing protein n=1 Tax=Acrobeloides nanus TaxID=290746 RepID=A0A914ENR4_9BILA
MSDKEKKLFLKNPYKPPTNFDWPYVTRQNGERRFLRPRHLEVPEAEWISYSPRLKGLICRACYFFAKSFTGHNSAFNRQSAFVEKPFTRFGHITSRTCGIPYHSLLDYHKNAVDAARVFLDSSLSNDIMKVMDQEFNEQHELLGQVIRTKVEAAIFLAKRSLSFRGHIDSGQLLIIENMQEFVGNEAFDAIISAISQCVDSCSQVKARAIATGILNKMGSSEFIFSMVLLGRTMNVLKSLSQILQSEDLDLTLLCVRQSTPSIYTLLQIFATIPVSSASAERGFSALKRIKTYLRNAMTEERLNGLALAHINNEIEISPDKIVSMMAEMGPRKFLKNRKRIANEPLEEIIR